MNKKNKKNYLKWVQKAKKELKNNKLNHLSSKTPDGIEIKPLYTIEDLKNLEHVFSYPGSEPYLRGPKATMYPNRPWTIRQYAGFSTAEESNAFYKANIKNGQTGLSVAFDLATHRGYDSDHSKVLGDVGKAGVAIDTVEDMKILFNGIPLEKMSVSMTMNGAVLPVLANFIVAGEEQGVPQNKLSGTIQNDILKEFMVRNTYIYPPEPSMRIVSDIIEYTSKSMPKFNSISISGYHMQEAGSTTAQELAFTLADGVEYVKCALSKGLKVDEFAPRLSFFFAIGIDFFMEIAKLRGARLLWSKLMKQFKPNDSRSSMLRTHCQTSGASLTEQDPYNNVVRTTIEAMASILGGTQSLHTNSFDEALALPSEESAQLALRTQQIIAFESGIPDVSDPLAGSYYIESLTDKLEIEANHLIDKIDLLGGAVNAIEQEFQQKTIASSSFDYQKAIDNREKIIVGVNKFESKENNQELTQTLNDKDVQLQLNRLLKFKKDRDMVKLQDSLNNLKEKSNSNENLMPYLIHAVKSHATLGEVSDIFREVFGEY